MFTVTGALDGVMYQLGVHDEPQEDGRHIMGSSDIISMLELHEGELAVATPTATPVELGLTDPRSILAFLMERTDVTSVEGDVPSPREGEGDMFKAVAGVVY